MYVVFSNKGSRHCSATVRITGDVTVSAASSPYLSMLRDCKCLVSSNQVTSLSTHTLSRFYGYGTPLFLNFLIRRAPPRSALHSRCRRNRVRFTSRTRSSVYSLQHWECGLQRPWRLSKISPGAGKASSARRHASPVTPYGTNATVTPSSATSCQGDDVRGWVHIGCVWRAQGRLLRCIVVEAESVSSSST